MNGILFFILINKKKPLTLPKDFKPPHVRLYYTLYSIEFVAKKTCLRQKHPLKLSIR